MRRTATTANALLGLLCLRPSWATYDLTKQLRRNMRFFWPRAESGIYETAKQLVAQGLARATRELRGSQERSTYAITTKGRRAVTRWLATPPQPTALECEALLRVFLADFATREQLSTAFQQLRDDAEAIQAVGRVVGAEYLNGTAPFQDQLHVRALVFDFLWSHASMLRAWADRTEQTVAQWSIQSATERDRSAAKRIAHILAQESAKPTR